MGFATNNPSDYFALGKQTAKDTEATTFAFFRHGGGTGLDLDEDVTSEREGGDGQEVGFRYKSMVKMDGAVAGNARSELALFGFAGVLGKTATVIDAGATVITPPATGLLRFRMTPNATLPWFTAEQRYTDIVERSTNMKVTSLELSGEAGKAISLSFSLIGAGTAYKRPIASALTPARESTDPVFFPRGTYVLEGAHNANITKFRVAARRSLDDGIQTTELWRADLVELNADYDLDFTLVYQNASLYEKIKYAAAAGTQIPINLSTGAFSALMNNAQAGTLARLVTVDLPSLDFVGAKLNKLEPDGKTVYIDVAAMTRKGATDSLIVDVVTASRAAIV